MATLTKAEKAAQREEYINWAAEQVALLGEGKDIYALVPGSEVWKKTGDKEYRVDIDERGNASRCECPNHQITRLSCKHMMATDRYLLALEGAA